MNWLAFLSDLAFYLDNARHNHADVSRELRDVDLQTRLEFDSLGYWLENAAADVEEIRASVQADLREFVERGRQ